MKEELTPREKLASRLLIPVRLIVLAVVATLFFPSMNPAIFVTKAGQANVSSTSALFTSAISYDSLTNGLNSAFKKGWLEQGHYVLLYIACIILVLGIVAMGASACMTLGNLKLKKLGVRIGFAGAVAQFVGVILMLVSYQMILGAADPARITMTFRPFIYFYVVAALLQMLIMSMVLIIVPKPAADAKFEMESKFKLFLMIMPFLLLCFAFSYLPLFSWRYAFYNYNAGETLTDKQSEVSTIYNGRLFEGDNKIVYEEMASSSATYKNLDMSAVYYDPQTLEVVESDGNVSIVASDDGSVTLHADKECNVKIQGIAYNWVGFKWFKTLFQNPTYVNRILRVLRNTLAMSGLGLLTSWLPMAFAIFLTEIKSMRFRRFVQTFTTVPNFISWVLIYAIAYAIFYSDGFINTLFGGSANYLNDASNMWLKMLAWGTWKGIGWSAIIYISGIAGIDQQLYEAATVDGAGRFQRMWHITLPGLLPTYVVMLIMQIAGILSNGMDQYLVFSNANNKDIIEVLDLYVYNLGIAESSQIPLSTVVGMSKSIISVILLFVANKVAKSIRGENIV